jgi:hypothetical protein
MSRCVCASVAKGNKLLCQWNSSLNGGGMSKDQKMRSPTRSISEPVSIKGGKISKDQLMRTPNFRSWLAFAPQAIWLPSKLRGRERSITSVAIIIKKG